MATLTPKRATVLRELLWLECESPRWAHDAHDGWWQPFHLRYFRGTGRRGTRAETPPSFVYEAGLSVDAVASHLRRLARDGLVDRLPGGAEYRVNHAGREALAEWDRSHVGT
jgi:hypothetical protein